MMPPVAILAGGLATRLYPLTRTIPKALIDIAGQPFIFRQLSLLKREGISKVVICAGYLGEQIKEAVGDGSSFGLWVEYSFDGDRLLGTGGALRKALPLLDDMFWVLYGDSYLDTKYDPVLKYFLSDNKSGLMTVYENQGKWDTSNVVFRDGKILKYDKKNLTPDIHHIDYGLSLFRKEALSHFSEGEVFDLPLIYSKLINDGELLGFEVKERFYEIGKPEGLEELRDYIKKIVASNNS